MNIVPYIKCEWFLRVKVCQKPFEAYSLFLTKGWKAIYMQTLKKRNVMINTETCMTCVLCFSVGLHHACIDKEQTINVTFLIRLAL